MGVRVWERNPYIYFSLDTTDLEDNTSLGVTESTDDIVLDSFFESFIEDYLDPANQTTLRLWFQLNLVDAVNAGLLTRL